MNTEKISLVFVLDALADILHALAKKCTEYGIVEK